MIWTLSSVLRRLPAALFASMLFLGAPLVAAGESAPGFEEIAPGIHVRAGLVAETTPDNHGAIANLGFIIGADSVAMIDSGGSVADGEAALAAIRAVTDKPVRYLINTHMHPDHVFGNQVFAAAGATIIGHGKLPAALGARAEHYKMSMREQLGPDAAEAVTVTLPDETVADTRRLDLGGRVIELRAWPTAHTDNDLTVFDEQTGTLFAGDLVFMAHVPVLDGSLKGWLARIGDLRELPAERVVPGHGPASAPWPQALDAEAAYLETLAADLRAAIAAGVPLSEAVETAGAGEADQWEVFDAFNARNATAGFAELEWE